MSFDIHRDLSEAREQPGGEKMVGEYIATLFKLFTESPEAQALPGFPAELGWTRTQLGLGYDFLGVTPPTTTYDDLEEIVFEIFPRKVTVQPSAAAEIITELAAFWLFLQREFQLENAAECLELFEDGAISLLEQDLANPSLFGPAKRFAMFSEEKGFDLTTEEGKVEAMAAYNLAQAAVSRPRTGAERLAPAPNAGRARALKKNRRKAAKVSRKKNRKRKRR